VSYTNAFPRTLPSRSLVLHPDKIKELRERKSLYEKQLKQKRREWNPDGRYYSNPLTDKDAIRKKIKDIDHTLQLYSPSNPRGVEKDKLWNRAKILVDELRSGMPNKFEMHPMQLNPATGKITKDVDILSYAVKKHMDWESRNKLKIIELKNIARTLGEPELGNVERLRPRHISDASRYVVK